MKNEDMIELDGGLGTTCLAEKMKVLTILYNIV